MSPQKCLNIEQRLIPKYFNRNVRTPGIKKKKRGSYILPKGAGEGGIGHKESVIRTTPDFSMAILKV